MTVREAAKEMEREELEAIAAGIIARLTGRTSAPEPGEAARHTAAKTEVGAGLPHAAAAGDAAPLWTAGTADSTGTERGGAGESVPAPVLRKAAVSSVETAAAGKEAPESYPSAPARRGADMRDISDFFMRDSRRYDNGFEKY